MKFYEDGQIDGIQDCAPCPVLSSAFCYAIIKAPAAHPSLRAGCRPPISSIKEGDPMATEKAPTCASCGAPLPLNIGSETIRCAYCGAEFITQHVVKESDAVRLARMELEEKHRLEQKAERQQEIARQKRELEAARYRFTHSPKGVLLLIYTVFISFGSFSMFFSGKLRNGFWLLIGSVFGWLAWAMGTRRVKSRRLVRYILALLALFALFFIAD